jgi:hypothetical protein
MKKLLSILITCLFAITACVAADRDITSLSSAYDGIWEGFTDTVEGRFRIKMEIKDGNMSGYVDDETQIKGYIKSDDKFVIWPFSVMGAQVRLATSFMSHDKIEGTVIAPGVRSKWFVEKTAPSN